MVKRVATYFRKMDVRWLRQNNRSGRNWDFTDVYLVIYYTFMQNINTVRLQIMACVY